MIRCGIDVALANGRSSAANAGLVTNEAARTAEGRPSRVALLAAGLRIKTLFSPEHGLQAAEDDGKAVADVTDAITGLPVVSLYGDTFAPKLEQIAGLDEIWFDLPVVGARFYTYLWTLLHTMEVCGQVGRKLVVLDRPNPIGGDLNVSEGPLLDTQTCSSLLGRSKMPIRYSLTIGELAAWWKRELDLNLELEIVHCRDWHRSMHWPETGLTFVPPSPAIRCYESALLYPGLCLFEATNLSVGRGTETPFQLIAAPWLKPGAITECLGAPPAGCSFEVTSCRPTQAPYAGITCPALRVSLPQPKLVRPVALGLRLLATVIEVHEVDFSWMPYPTAANPSGNRHFEMLIGREGIREALKNQRQPGEVITEWTDPGDWPQRVAPVLLYE